MLPNHRTRRLQSHRRGSQRSRPGTRRISVAGSGQGMAQPARGRLSDQTAPLLSYPHRMPTPTSNAKSRYSSHAPSSSRPDHPGPQPQQRELLNRGRRPRQPRAVPRSVWLISAVGWGLCCSAKGHCELDSFVALDTTDDVEEITCVWVAVRS